MPSISSLGPRWQKDIVVAADGAPTSAEAVAPTAFALIPMAPAAQTTHCTDGIVLAAGADDDAAMSACQTLLLFRFLFPYQSLLPYASFVSN